MVVYPSPNRNPLPTPNLPPPSEEEEEVYIPSTPISDGLHDYSLGTMLYVDGKRVRGLYESEGATYFFNDQGFMQTGWVEFAEGWRYFSEDGKMATGWLQIGNAWYYLDPETGLMFNDGLAIIGKSTYYFYDWGGMAFDWWYEDEAGDWYFFGGSGAMKAAQWLEWKGDWYYPHRVRQNGSGYRNRRVLCKRIRRLGRIIPPFKPAQKAPSLKGPFKLPGIFGKSGRGIAGKHLLAKWHIFFPPVRKM